MTFLISSYVRNVMKEYLFIEANTPEQAIDFVLTSNKFVHTKDVRAEEVKPIRVTDHRNTLNIKLTQSFDCVYVKAY